MTSSPRRLRRPFTLSSDLWRKCRRIGSAYLWTPSAAQPADAAAEMPRSGIIVSSDLPLTILVAVATTVIMGLLRADRAPTLVGVAVAPLIADVVRNVAKRARVSWFSVIATAFVATGATVAFFTLPELVFGRALVAPDRPTTFFSTAEPAPKRVVKSFKSFFSEGAPEGMDPRVVAAETRRIGVMHSHVLWVAPTRSGGYCYVWEDSSGGCDSLGTVPLDVTWGSDGAPLSSRRPSFQIVEGTVRTRWADDVEIVLDDGTTVHPRVIWVSPPIDVGFFFYRARTGRAIQSVLALKESEVVTGDTTGSGAQPGAHPFADLSQRRRVAEIPTSMGPATLWTAPTKAEERCTWLEFGQEEIPVVPCLPKGYERQAALGYNTYRLDGHTVLAGECGYRAVELLHRDGRIRTVDCEDSLIFVDLEPADAAGDLRAVDANGNPVPGSRAPVSPQMARSGSDSVGKEP